MLQPRESGSELPHSETWMSERASVRFKAIGRDARRWRLRMRTYRLQQRLSHADVDFLGELKVTALLGLLEQAAVEASSAAGYDAPRYMQEGRIWIIRRTQLQRGRAVGGTDVIDARDMGAETSGVHVHCGVMTSFTLAPRWRVPARIGCIAIWAAAGRCAAGGAAARARGRICKRARPPRSVTRGSRRDTAPAAGVRAAFTPRPRRPREQRDLHPLPRRRCLRPVCGERVDVTAYAQQRRCAAHRKRRRRVLQRRTAR